MLVTAALPDVRLTAEKEQAAAPGASLVETAPQCGHLALASH
jgi:hypothetical protein